jgi:hypothetical protein
MVRRAGFEEVGKTDWLLPEPDCDWRCDWVCVNVLEFERVGEGVTGPMERREAAKWGSRPSRSIARRRRLC